MKSNQLLICVLSCLILTACANPQTGGIGLHGAPPSPTPQPEITELTQKIVDAYNSLSYLPDQGAKKVSEYSRSVDMSSGPPCVYKVTETMELVETDPEVITTFKYNQELEGKNSEFCPAKDPFLTDKTTTQKFREYATDRIGQFYKFAEIKTFLEIHNSWARSAEITSMQSITHLGVSALKVRLKVLDRNNQTYFLQTIYSKDNSFLAILDQQLTRIADNKVMSYRRWIAQ